jgi:nucleotide-binding universal stress UspA family protein
MAHVIVPLDQSLVAEAAIPWAARIARAKGLGIHLVTVYASDAARWEFADVDPRESPVVMRSTVPDYLENARRSQEFAGLRVTVEVRPGDVAGEILAASEEPDAGLVVITTRGRGGAGPGAWGSVADKLVRVMRRPLVVVPPEAELGDLESVLVTLDGSSAAEAVLPVARDLAEALGSQVHLLHVVDEDIGWGLADEDWAGYRERLVRDARVYLGGIGRPGEVLSVQAGHPVMTILDYASEFDCRMLAMATHGRSGALRLELGSTADAILHRTNRPVLLVRVATG